MVFMTKGKSRQFVVWKASFVLLSFVSFLILLPDDRILAAVQWVNIKLQELYMSVSSAILHFLWLIYHIICDWYFLHFFLDVHYTRFIGFVRIWRVYSSHMCFLIGEGASSRILLISISIWFIISCQYFRIMKYHGQSFFSIASLTGETRLLTCSTG